MDDKLYEYADRFNEPFPLFMMPSMTDEEIIAIIDKCLASGKPYEPKNVSYNSKVNY